MLDILDQEEIFIQRVLGTRFFEALQEERLSPDQVEEGVWPLPVGEFPG